MSKETIKQTQWKSSNWYQQQLDQSREQRGVLNITVLSHLLLKWQGFTFKMHPPLSTPALLEPEICHRHLYISTSASPLCPVAGILTEQSLLALHTLFALFSLDC